MITIELLKSKGACEDGLNYFKKLPQDSYDILDLIKQCCEDGEQDYADWLFKCCKNLFTKTTFKSAVEYHIKNHFCLARARECQAYLIENGTLEKWEFWKKE
jgi:hypothetical protein